MLRVKWQPGNGTLYNLAYQVDGNRVYLMWLFNGGSGGTCFSCQLDSFVHWCYLSEKMGLNSASDAAGLLAFLHTQGIAVGLPEDSGRFFRPGWPEIHGFQDLFDSLANVG